MTSWSSPVYFEYSTWWSVDDKLLMIPMIVFVLCLFVDLYIFVFVAWTGLCPPQLWSRPSKRQKAQKSRDQIHSQEKLRPDPFTQKKLRRDSIHSQDPSIASVLAQLWRFRSKNPIESKKNCNRAHMPCMFNSSEVCSIFCWKYVSRFRNINNIWIWKWIQTTSEGVSPFSL